MKEKLFDLVLVMLLILVAFAVGLTLFGSSFSLGGIGKGFGLPGSNNNPNTGHVVTIDTAATNNLGQASPSESGAVSVIVPTVDLPANPGSQSQVGTTEESSDNPTETVSTSNNSNNTTSTDMGNSEAEVAVTQPIVAAPLPEGAIELQSIGFSYVTGGAGACGITLEAWKHVAVSRDILAKYPCGTKITISIDKSINSHKSFEAIVADTMNKKHSRTVNIYVAKSEPALEYGRQTGNLIP